MSLLADIIVIVVLCAIVLVVPVGMAAETVIDHIRRVQADKKAGRLVQDRHCKWVRVHLELDTGYGVLTHTCLLDDGLLKGAEKVAFGDIEEMIRGIERREEIAAQPVPVMDTSCTDCEWQTVSSFSGDVTRRYLTKHCPTHSGRYLWKDA